MYKKQIEVPIDVIFRKNYEETGRSLRHLMFSVPQVYHFHNLAHETEVIGVSDML
jgi:hypothetical protein